VTIDVNEVPPMTHFFIPKQRCASTGSGAAAQLQALAKFVRLRKDGVIIPEKSEHVPSTNGLSDCPTLRHVVIGISEMPTMQLPKKTRINAHNFNLTTIFTTCQRYSNT
jgi:hypothetical protein